MLRADTAEGPRHTMIFLHTKHATKEIIPEGVLMAKTGDTGILFIPVNMMSALQETGLQQL